MYLCSNYKKDKNLLDTLPFVILELTMASLCMVLVGILYFSLCQCLLFSSTENIGDNLDWKVASRKILELEKLVKDQNDRISALEKRQPEAELKSQTEFIQKQNARISQLEARILELEAEGNADPVESSHLESHERVSESKQNDISSKRSSIRKCKFLLKKKQTKKQQQQQT